MERGTALRVGPSLVAVMGNFIVSVLADRRFGTRSDAAIVPGKRPIEHSNKLNYGSKGDTHLHL